MAAYKATVAAMKTVQCIYGAHLLRCTLLFGLGERCADVRQYFFGTEDDRQLVAGCTVAFRAPSLEEELRHSARWRLAVHVEQVGKKKAPGEYDHGEGRLPEKPDRTSWLTETAVKILTGGLKREPNSHSF